MARGKKGKGKERHAAFNLTLFKAREGRREKSRGSNISTSVHSSGKKKKRRREEAHHLTTGRGVSTKPPRERGGKRLFTPCFSPRKHQEKIILNTVAIYWPATFNKLWTRRESSRNAALAPGSSAAARKGRGVERGRGC